jgi:formylglycine-generating enzyme required for sulfatase activity
MKKFLSILLLAMTIPFHSLAQSQETAKDKGPENMVLIPGGTYEMGSRRSLLELNPADLMNTDRHALGPENPAHEVQMDGFYIGIYEVTNEEYAEFTKQTGAPSARFAADSDFNGPRQPVVGVSWKQAQKYCQWKDQRLPTEAEWEMASRGKRRVRFPWGNEPPNSSRLNYNEELNKTAPVGSYEKGKSDYGIYDLAGNVSEWTADWHLPEYYLFSPKSNPEGPEKGHYKVIRGGNWRNVAQDVTMTYRNATVPKMQNTTVGFRCAKDAKL